MPSKIPQGSDAKININLTKSGVAYDISAATGLIVFIRGSNGAIINRYSNKSITDYDILTVESAAQGQISVLLQSNETKSAPAGPIYAEVKIEFANSDYDNNTFHAVKGEFAIAEIEAGITKDVLDLTP